MKTARIASLLSFVVAIAAFAAGCSGREVEARGQVTAPAGQSAQAVVIDFYDLPKEEGGEVKKVDTLKLDKLGDFSKKISVSGDKIRIVAVGDANGNGACDNGESWDSIDVVVEDDDTVKPVALMLKTVTDCPKN